MILIICKFVVVTEVLVLTDKHRGDHVVKNTGLFLQRRECITSYLPRRLGVKVVNSLVTFSLFVWPRKHYIIPQSLIISLSIKRTYLLEDFRCTYKEFGCSHAQCYLAFLVPQGELCIMYTVLSHHQETFHQIVLGLNISTINYSGLDSQI